MTVSFNVLTSVLASSLARSFPFLRTLGVRNFELLPQLGLLCGELPQAEPY